MNPSPAANSFLDRLGQFPSISLLVQLVQFTKGTSIVVIRVRRASLPVINSRRHSFSLYGVIDAFSNSMFLRFVSAEVDRRSHVSAGIFMAACKLRDEGELSDYEYETLMDLLYWFSLYLERPDRFSRSSRCETYKAICWFKSSAREHLAKIREMVLVLENNGMFIRMIKSPRVGYVVYEDEHQVVAEPFADMNL